MDIELLTANDADVLARAVQRFRKLDGIDHQGFLSDTSAFTFVAVDRFEIVGWA